MTFDNSNPDLAFTSVWTECLHGLQWILVEFDGEFDISKIKFTPTQSLAGNTTLEILITKDFLNWNSIDLFTLYTSDKKTFEHSLSQKGVVGVNILTKNSPSLISWSEIEIFGIYLAVKPISQIERFKNDGWYPYSGLNSLEEMFNEYTTKMNEKDKKGNPIYIRSIGSDVTSTLKNSRKQAIELGKNGIAT